MRLMEELEYLRPENHALKQYVKELEAKVKALEVELGVVMADRDQVSEHRDQLLFRLQGLEK